MNAETKSRPLVPSLIPSLNALLTALALPFNVEHPSDLTPSLLLAIFESIIAARLPIPQTIRQSRTRDAKSRAMLVLLGILECDILRGGTDDDDTAHTGAGGVSVDGWADDIGLGEVDPERLADGEWEETIFIGELLCWLSRRKGILPRTASAHRPRSLYSNHHSYGDEGDSLDLSTSLLLRPSHDADYSSLSHVTDIPRHPLVHSPEPSFSASATISTDLSIRARSVSSRTSISNTHDPDDIDDASHDTLRLHNPRQMMQDAVDDDDRPPTFRPRCIHELEDPSYIRALGTSSSSVHLSEDEHEAGIDELCVPPTPTPQRVRLTGWIEPVDAHAEIAAFHASRSSSTRSRTTRHVSPLLPSSSPSPPPPPTVAAPKRVSFRSTRTPRPSRASPSPPSSPVWVDVEPDTDPDTDTDTPFDVSFSTLNKTSTPAKPTRARPKLGHSRRQTRTRTDAVPLLSFGSDVLTGHQPTPLRSDARASGKDPTKTAIALGSTARTNALLTERARLLTELAALKRARSMSGEGSGGAGARSKGIGVVGYI